MCGPASQAEGSMATRAREQKKENNQPKKSCHPASTRRRAPHRFEVDSHDGVTESRRPNGLSRRRSSAARRWSEHAIRYSAPPLAFLPARNGKVASSLGSVWPSRSGTALGAGQSSKDWCRAATSQEAPPYSWTRVRAEAAGVNRRNAAGNRRARPVAALYASALRASRMIGVDGERPTACGLAR